jgi:hypothetical protein
MDLDVTLSAAGRRVPPFSGEAVVNGSSHPVVGRQRSFGLTGASLLTGSTGPAMVTAPFPMVTSSTSSSVPGSLPPIVRVARARGDQRLNNSNNGTPVMPSSTDELQSWADHQDSNPEQLILPLEREAPPLIAEGMDGAVKPPPTTQQRRMIEAMDSSPTPKPKESRAPQHQEDDLDDATGRGSFVIAGDVVVGAASTSGANNRVPQSAPLTSSSTAISEEEPKKATSGSSRRSSRRGSLQSSVNEGDLFDDFDVDHSGIHPSRRHMTNPSGSDSGNDDEDDDEDSDSVEGDQGDEFNHSPATLSAASGSGHDDDDDERIVHEQSSASAKQHELGRESPPVQLSYHPQEDAVPGKVVVGRSNALHRQSVTPAADNGHWEARSHADGSGANNEVQRALDFEATARAHDELVSREAAPFVSHDATLAGSIRHAVMPLVADGSPPTLLAPPPRTSSENTNAAAAETVPAASATRLRLPFTAATPRTPLSPPPLPSRSPFVHQSRRQHSVAAPHVVGSESGPLAHQQQQQQQQQRHLLQTESEFTASQRSFELRHNALHLREQTLEAEQLALKMRAEDLDRRENAVHQIEAAVEDARASIRAESKLLMRNVRSLHSLLLQAKCMDLATNALRNDESMGSATKPFERSPTPQRTIQSSPLRTPRRRIDRNGRHAGMDGASASTGDISIPGEALPIKTTTVDDAARIEEEERIGAAIGGDSRYDTRVISVAALVVVTVGTLVTGAGICLALFFPS